MNLEILAKIVEAEASVLPFAGKLGVAQCILDNGNNLSAFAAPADDYSGESMQAVRAVYEQGVRRLPGYQILMFRSFNKYGPDGIPDWEKLVTGPAPIPGDMAYLGKDGMPGSWGHYYFGRRREMKNFRMLVMAGHGRNMDGSYDPGAVGCGYEEATLTRELTQLVKEEADRQGVSCDVAPDRNHYSFFKNGGSYDVTGYKYVLEIHFNASVNPDCAGNGQMTGSMVYIDQSETGHSVEDAILSNLYAIGSKQAWDGVVITQRQYQTGLMVQNHIRAQGVSHAVLETCFISDRDDMNWYQAHKREIARAILAGIRKGFGLDEGWEPYMVHVSIPDLNIRISPTVDAPSVGHTGVGSFTIMEEAIGKVNMKTGAKGLWGRLLSGAGWICLAYTEPIN